MMTNVFYPDPHAIIQTMKIVADENIPLLKECFGDIGTIVARPGREMTPADVHDADALLVRSVTRVNQALLEDSSVKFIATATAGVDHIDQEYLEQRQIGFAYAPGCNATAVTEYVLAALDILAEKYGFSLQDRTVGVVGKGQVGRRLVQTLQRMGVKVLVSDPLCEPVEGVALVSLNQLIQCCDVISLHTPLTTTGFHPTYHMIAANELKAMKPGTVLISAGRGAVVDNNALQACLESGQDLKVVIDVWEQEPAVNQGLLTGVELGTPHIAGYSLDGKIAGTELIYRAFCTFFGLPARVRTAAITPIAPLRTMGFAESVSVTAAASLAIRGVYDIRRDDMWMRRLLAMDQASARHAFDRMRKTYPVRREFSTLRMRLQCSDEAARERLVSLGFSVVGESVV
ncbi:4-phosphoerythronate dehydrogenase PdxB [Endozoicomonas sp.]|nr:4-phosphoerythronate dehydrogenase PdxB [Endozoicomonas sp.]